MKLSRGPRLLKGETEEKEEAKLLKILRIPWRKFKLNRKLQDPLKPGKNGGNIHHRSLISSL